MTRLPLIDRFALGIVIALMLIGVLFVWSSTHQNPALSNLWLKQLIYGASGLVIYLFLAVRDYRSLMDKANWFGLLGILLLAAVLIFGVKINGARSWFRLPMMSLQPSEFVKIATILWVAKYFSKFQERPSSLAEFILAGVMLSIPVALIALQPDLGTALLYIPFFLIPNFLVGNRESIWVTGGGIFVVLLVVLGVLYKPNWVFFLKPYQQDRIVSFIYPERDTKNSGYQVHQSKISIGQGGLFGQGIGKGKQTKLGFLPAQHNDFILAVVAEEAGFLGICLVLLLFCILFLRCFNVAAEASDVGGSILVSLVVGTLALQTLFNASMLTGLVPTTGIPCPLVSAGGSSMWTTCALLGIVQSVRTHRFVNH